MRFPEGCRARRGMRPGCGKNSPRHDVAGQQDVIAPAVSDGAPEDIAKGGAGKGEAYRGRARAAVAWAPQRTRMPGLAPGQGCRTYTPGSAFSSAWLAASTMPSDTPNFILRGARLATMTVSLPTRSSGW